MLDAPQPVYVNRWGMSGSLQPFMCMDARSYEFIFKGDMTKLQGLCDRYLNLGNQQDAFHYEPLTSYILLTFTQIARLAPAQPPYSECGWMGEIEVTFWVLVLAKKGLIPDHLALFMPYMFVGNPLAISQGREIYGFPKEIGYFEVPWNDPSPVSLSVTALVMPQFSPGAKMQQGLELALFQTSRPAPPDTPGDWTTIDEGLATIRKLLTPPNPDGSIPASLLNSIIPHSGNAALLKQFCDAGNSDYACYQAIVEAPVTVTGWTSLAKIDQSYQIALPELDSHPIAGDLGIANQQPATLAYRSEYSFELGAGSTIWRAPGA